MGSTSPRENSLTISRIKDACSKILEIKLLYFKLTDMVTFQTKTTSTVKKLQISISFESNDRKQFMLFTVYKTVETMFSNFQVFFH